VLSKALPRLRVLILGIGSQQHYSDRLHGGLPKRERMKSIHLIRIHTVSSF
jgi:hypothetical protein